MAQRFPRLHTSSYIVLRRDDLIQVNPLPEQLWLIITLSCVASSVKAELEIRASRLYATTYAETLYCYGHDSTRRRFRSTVEYQPKMIPVRYSDTRYVLPKRLTSTYVSYVDVNRPCDPHRPRWYQSSVTFGSAMLADSDGCRSDRRTSRAFQTATIMTNGT